jgi:hypothetical protein
VPSHGLCHRHDNLLQDVGGGGQHEAKVSDSRFTAERTVGQSHLGFVGEELRPGAISVNAWEASRIEPGDLGSLGFLIGHLGEVGRQ